MDQQSKLDELARKITALLPAGAQQVQQDIEANVRGLLQTALSQMNLVTREEFDVQMELLKRTREKLERIESLLEELEQQRN